MVGHALTATLWLGTATAAPTEPPSVETAEQAFVAGDYARASAGFAEAYATEPNPRYLYAQAQSERLAGNCPLALQLYDEFLAQDPPAKAAEDARANRARCTTAAPPPPPTTSDAGGATTPEPEGPADGDRPPSSTRPWYRDPWGGALAGSGMFVGGLGIGLIINAVNLDEDAASAPNEGAYETTREDAKVRHRVGIGVTAAGAALLVGGIVRWTIVGVRYNRSRTVSLAPAPGGLVLRGRF